MVQRDRVLNSELLQPGFVHDQTGVFGLTVAGSATVHFLLNTAAPFARPESRSMRSLKHAFTTSNSPEKIQFLQFRIQPVQKYVRLIDIWQVGRFHQKIVARLQYLAQYKMTARPDPGRPDAMR